VNTYSWRTSPAVQRIFSGTAGSPVEFPGTIDVIESYAGIPPGPPNCLILTGRDANRLDGIIKMTGMNVEQMKKNEPAIWSISCRVIGTTEEQKNGA
jgi:hypothetical protein